MKEPLIRICDGIPIHSAYRLAEPLNFSLFEGEHLAVCGPNGGGKTLFVDILTGRHVLKGEAPHNNFPPSQAKSDSQNILTITFRDVYGEVQPSYYQQRWNRADEQEFPAVREVLGTKWERNVDLLAEVGVLDKLDEPINCLSSGELRRLQLAKMLLHRPRLLVIDNPYIGLDVGARAMLTKMLTQLSSRLTLVLIVSRESDIPPFVKQVVRVEDLKVGEAKRHFPAQAPSSAMPTSQDGIQADGGAWPSKAVAEVPERGGCTSFAGETRTASSKNAPAVIDFRHITVKYGRRTILRDLSWQVRQGEHWALTGENGAGKSTLLSLVCADNPQAYACDIRLFGFQRGRGESIWEIKKHIGYVSPEIYSTYRKDLRAIDIVASGLHDTVGLYKQCSPDEEVRCRAWLRAFKAENLAERDYLKLSSGEQRLILLVRAFVKNPTLLILDEPFHGLDDERREHARALIDRFMADPLKTLIMVTHYEEEFPSCIDHHLKLIKQA